MPRSLVTIENGTLADATVVNANFTYLDDRITANGSSITTLQSSIQSVNANLNAEINNVKSEIEADVQEDLEGKADIDGSNMATSVKKFDGQWVINQVELSTSTATGTYTLDLSSILPNDGYGYELLLSSYITRPTSGTGLNTVYDILNSSETVRWTRLEADKDNFQQCNETFIAIVGAERSLKLIISSAKADGANTNLLAYRRIGTNN